MYQESQSKITIQFAICPRDNLNEICRVGLITFCQNLDTFWDISSNFIFFAKELNDNDYVCVSSTYLLKPFSGSSKSLNWPLIRHQIKFVEIISWCQMLAQLLNWLRWIVSCLRGYKKTFIKSITNVIFRHK